MLTKNSFCQIVYILAVPFLIWNFFSCLQTILAISMELSFLQMALPMSIVGVILVLFGYFKCDKELSLGLILSGFVLVCQAILKIFARSGFVLVMICGAGCLFLIARYLYQDLWMGKKITKQNMKIFFKSLLIFLLVIFCVLKVTSYSLEFMLPSQANADNSEIYIDFVKGYAAIHPEIEKPTTVAKLAWQKFIKDEAAFYSSYFFTVSLSGMLSVLSFYLGCSVSSPVVACACIASGMTIYMYQMGMNGMALHYGCMIEMMYFLLALVFVLQYLYRKSKKQ